MKKSDIITIKRKVKLINQLNEEAKGLTDEQLKRNPFKPLNNRINERLNELVQIEKRRNELPLHCCKITNEKWLNELTEENEILKNRVKLRTDKIKSLVDEKKVNETLISLLMEKTEILEDEVKTLKSLLSLKGKFGLKGKVVTTFKEYEPLKEIDTEKGRKVAQSIRELK